MGARYMSFEEHMRDQWKAGRATGREELIAKALEKGTAVETVADLLNIPLEEVLRVQEKMYIV